MYTLQILDAGQTFLRTLGDRPVTFGASESVDVKLEERGVAAEHARIRMEDGVARIEAESGAEVLLNGQPVTSAELHLGDRVELGRAVIVVGRTVSRAARPEDVLAGALPRPSRRVRQPQQKSRMLPIATVLGVVLVVAAFFLLQDDSAEVQSRVAYLASLVTEGKLDEAEREVAVLRRQWRDAEDGRLAKVDACEARLQTVFDARDALAAQVADPTSDRSYAEWVEDLQRREGRGTDLERVAARKVRSRLGELLRERDDARRALPRDPVAADGADATARPGSGATGAGDADQPDRSGDVNTAADGGAVGGTGTARNGSTPDAGAAEEVGDAGLGGGDLGSAGLAELSAPEPTAPAADTDTAPSADATPSADAATVTHEVDEATRLRTLANLRTHLDRVRTAEESGDFAAAGRLLHEAAAAVRDRDAAYATRLERRAADLELLDVWHTAVREAVASGRNPRIPDLRGRQLELLRVEGATIIARSADGDARLDWHDVGADGIAVLVEELDVADRATLGAAALLLRQDAREAAERLLATLWQASRQELRGEVERLLAIGREEPLDSHYELRSGAFVSLREIEIEKRSKQMRGELARAVRAGAEARQRFVDKAADGDPLDAEVLAVALRHEFDATIERVQSHSVRRQVDRLTEERTQLDAARTHARELIYDTVRYFYPYKPPAVSGEKHAEYNRVQAEVDERVDGLRRLWQASRTRVRVPKKLGEELEQLDWLANQLSRFGGFPLGRSRSAAMQPVEWARALEIGGTVTLQDFALTVEERDRMRRWRRIDAYNEAIGKQVSGAVRSQLEVTNAYRRMFGHRPVALVLTASEAAQGHADEMSTLGYFSHNSPTPGRTTPNDRMRLAGYEAGVSENIAKTGGPEAAHNAWCRSSGHHRNLLHPNHTEVGIGANGSMWVQCFGRGKVFEQTPEWSAADER